MKKINFTLVFIFLATLAFSQNAKKVKEIRSTDLFSATVTSENHYIAGTTMDLHFILDFQTPDFEYGDYISLTFPAGITPNGSPTDPIAITTEGQVPCNLNGVSGQTISWGTDNNDQWGGIEIGQHPFIVNVTIDEGVTGDQVIDILVSGSTYGTPQGNINITCTVQEMPTSPDLSVVSGWGIEYTNYPLAQVASFPFFAEVSNGGVELNTATDIVATCDLASYDETIAISLPLATGGSEAFTFPEITPFTVGTHEIIIEANADGDPYTANNSDTITIVVDSVYAHDDGGAAYTYGSTYLQFRMGAAFDIITEDDLTGVQFYLGENAPIGAEFSLSVLPVTTSGEVATYGVPVWESENLFVDESMQGAWTTVPAQNSDPLEVGKYALLINEHESGSIELGFDGNPEGDILLSVNDDNNYWEDQAYGWAMVRLVLGEKSTVSIDPPTNFTAEVVDGNDVEMNWVAPGGVGYIQWDAGTNTGNGIGLTNGGTFMVASRWSPADLAPYDGNYMTSITFFHNDDPTATFVLKAWTGANAGTEILSQPVAATNMGDFNEIPLDNPILIDASQELWFGYELTHGAGTFPAGCDDGPAVQEFGDLISTDGGSSWTGMSAAYGLDYNWNIAGYLSSSDNGKDIAVPMVKQSIAAANGTPVASGSNGKIVKMDKKANRGLIGYNVYRDGVVIAEEIGASSYTDYDLVPGSFTYDVKAVYAEGVSDGAGPVEVTILGGVDRELVIIEVATGTWCQYCPGAAMGVDAMHAEGLSVGVIEYHSGDAYETTESSARIAYNGVTGFPTAVFDGGDKYAGGSATQSLYSTYLPKYQSRMDVPSLFEIDATYEHVGDDNYQVTIDAEMIDTYPSLTNDIVLQVALTESHIPENWQNQTEVNFVCRDMIPTENGTSLDFAGSATQTVTLDFTVPSSYVTDNLELVVFIQDNTTKEILQGALANYLPVGIEEGVDEQEITVYPNPATDVVNVSAGTGIQSITVYNSVGQVISVERAESNQYRINTANYETGIYLFQIETAEGRISKRIIIE